MNIRARIRARESASDLVQSICREVPEDIGDFRGAHPLEFKNWLFTLALNKIRGRNVVMKAQRRDVDREKPQVTGFEELMTCYSRIYTPSRIPPAQYPPSGSASACSWRRPVRRVRNTKPPEFFQAQPPPVAGQHLPARIKFERTRFTVRQRWWFTERTFSEGK